MEASITFKGNKGNKGKRRGKKLLWQCPTCYKKDFSFNPPEFCDFCGAPVNIYGDKEQIGAPCPITGAPCQEVKASCKNYCWLKN